MAALVSAATALLVTAAWWSAKGGTFHWSAAGTWEILGGGVAANAAFAAIGVCFRRELDGDWLTAVLVAAAPLECRAW